jgi:hypothetical protein
MEYPSRFNEESRYLFTNWSNEDYTGTWNGVSQTVKAGTYVELPEYKAFHYCRHFVDREMFKDKKDTLVGVDAARKPYEEKTIAKIEEGMDSPALAEIKKQIAKDLKKDKKDDAPSASDMEFSDIKKK